MEPRGAEKPAGSGWQRARGCSPPGLVPICRPAIILRVILVQNLPFTDGPAECRAGERVISFQLRY